jgi:hypothetical protein
MGMVRLIRICIGMALFACAAFVSAQGSAGGYGQGGGFGGGGGIGGASAPITVDGRPTGAGRSVFDDNRTRDRAKPDDEEYPGIWDTKSAILTPGDYVEVKFKVKTGEVLLAGVTSDAFDPALAIEDDKGKTLAKNDDRALGDQSPFLVFRFPADGTYTLKVVSYRPVSGGKFTLRTRTFHPLDAALTLAKHEYPQEPGAEQLNRIVFRLTAVKGHVYDLFHVTTTKPNVNVGDNFVRIVGPTGVEESDFEMIPTADSTPLFKAKADGDYFVEFTTNGGTEFLTDFREVSVIQAKPSDDVQMEFHGQEMKLVEFQVQPDQIVRTAIKGGSLSHKLSSPPGPARNETAEPSFGNNQYWAYYRMNSDSDLDMVRVFHGTGTAYVAIRSYSGDNQKVSLTNSDSLPAWTTGEPLKNSLEIGDARLLVVKSSKSELMKVFAQGSHFQSKLEIFRLDGELANTLCDRRAHSAGDDLYFPDAGTFIVRLSCDGNGGSGDFTMKRDSLAPKAYSLGKTETMKLDGTNFGLYSVDLVAGKRYELVTDDPGNYLRADLLDDDGQFLTSQAIGFDKVLVHYFVPTKSGHHRLWLRGAPGSRQFRFGLNVPPNVAGG